MPVMILPGKAATAALLVLMAATCLQAQTTTATIEGTVTDATGAPLPGAGVAVAGDTVARTLVTDGAGFYRAAALPPGRFTVTATLSGFRPATTGPVSAPIDATLTIDLTLGIAARDETVLVRATPPLIDRSTSAVVHAVDAQTIQAIPLNGRNYLDLVQLAPGVVVNPGGGGLGNRDTRGAMFGERAGNTAFLIDGLENDDDFRGGVLQPFTQDAVQEFEIVQAGYKAEFGRGSGGIVNVITKSGTNELHGSGFLFVRNDALDASNVSGTEAPYLRRYNPGLTVGGPIARKHAWFFGSVEHVREIREALFPPDVPSQLLEGEDFSQRPETSQDRLFGKYTGRMRERHDLRIDGSWSRLDDRNELTSPTSLPSAASRSATRSGLVTAALTSVYGARWALESSVGFRAQSFGRNEQLGDGPGGSLDILFLDDGRSYEFGPPYGDRQTLDQRYLTARQTVSLFGGAAHVAKAGIEYARTVVDGTNASALTDFIATTRANFARFGLESFQIPQGAGFATPEDGLTRLRNHGISLFAQDDWRLGSSLTLNLGLRYDYDSLLGDTDNLAPRLGLVWTPSARTVVRATWGLFYDRGRLGIAQPVPELGGFNGRIIVEAQYPRLAADALPLPGGLGQLTAATGDPFFLHRAFGIPESAVVRRDTVQALTGLSPEQFLARLTHVLATVPRTFLPVDFSPDSGYLRQDQAPPSQDRIRVTDPFRTPFNRTVSLGVERQIGSSITAGATWLHRDIRNIVGVLLTNLAFESRVAGRAMTTDGGPLQRSYGPWYDGGYDALVLSVERRAAGGHQLQASYTYARGEDNLMNSNLGLGLAAQGGGAVPTDNLDVEVDRGNSDFVVPHTFVASGVLALPWQLSASGIVRATSGTFFSASGTLRDYDGDGLQSRRPLTTRRNQFRGPSTFNLDVRLEKRVTVGRYTISGLIEAFNLTNARNPRLIDNNFVGDAPGPAFGEILVPLPGREAQIGVRFLF